MKLLIPLAFCLTASVASAQTCKGKDLVIIPEMEAAKDAFFEKDYEQFAELLGYSFPVPPNGAAASVITRFSPVITCHIFLR